MSATGDDLPWPETRRLVRPEDLANPATQFVADRDAYLGQSREVGRRVSPDQVELFATADPATTLQTALRQQDAEYIAVHDIGTGASLHLLGALASASGARVQRLAMRRQGPGVPLAVMQFVEAQLADDSLVRVYSTDAAADGSTRTELARVLLAHSRLGVVLVGELSAAALGGALQPLREALAQGLWPNRELLLLPLGSGTSLAAYASQLTAAARGVSVRVTPRASKPRQAWTYVAGAWNRSHGGPQGERALDPELKLAVPRPEAPPNEAPTALMSLESPAHDAASDTEPPEPDSAPSHSPSALAPRPLQAGIGLKRMTGGELNLDAQPVDGPSGAGFTAESRLFAPTGAADPEFVQTERLPGLPPRDEPETSGFGADAPAPTARAAFRAPRAMAPPLQTWPALPPLRPLSALPDEGAGPVNASAAGDSPSHTQWLDYARRCAAIKGALGCCVFDIPSAEALAWVGPDRVREQLATQGSRLLSAVADAARSLGLPILRPEAAVSTGKHHQLLRAVPGHPGVALHLLLDGEQANLTLARMQLERVEVPR
jgi:hypothetical protein